MGLFWGGPVANMSKTIDIFCLHKMKRVNLECRIESLLYGECFWMFRFTRFGFFQIFRRSTEVTCDHILNAKNQVTDRKTEMLGHKYRYWILLSDQIDRHGRKIVGLYHYIGLQDYKSWRNLMSACGLEKQSYRNLCWTKDVGINIFKYSESTKNPSNNGSLLHRLASILILLMGEPKVKTDLMFIPGYSRAFCIGHFKWLQSHDAVGKELLSFSAYDNENVFDKMCAATNRDETLRSLFALCRSFFIMILKH